MESADVNTRAIAVSGRPMRITHALLVILPGAAVWWHVVVATTAQEIAAMNCAAFRRVVGRYVVFIAFPVDEILAHS